MKNLDKDTVRKSVTWGFAKIVKGIWTTFLITLTISSLAFLLFLLPPVERAVGRYVAQAIGDATGLPTTVDKVSYFPFTTIKLLGISISDSDSVPMIEMRQAKADLSVTSLWRKSITLNEIDIDSLLVCLRQNEDGSLNIEQLVPQDTTGTGAPAKLRIGLVQARNCNISLQRQGEPTERLSNIGLTVSDIAVDSAFVAANIERLVFDIPNYKLRFDGRTSMLVNGDTVLAQQLHAGLSHSYVEADSLRLQIDPTSPMGIGEAFLQLNVLRMDSSLIQRLTGRAIPSSTLRAQIQVNGNDIEIANGLLTTAQKTECSFAGNINVDYNRPQSSSVHAVVESLRTNIADITALTGSAAPQDLDNVGTIDLHGEMRKSDRTANVEASGRCGLGNITLIASAITLNDEWTDIEFDGNAQIKLLAQIQDLMIGKGDIDVDLSNGFAKANGTFGAVVKLESREIEILGHTYDNIHGEATFNDQKIVSYVEVRDPAAVLDAVVNTNWEGSNISITMEANNLELEAMHIPGSRPNADLSFEIEAEMEGATADQAKARLIVRDLAYTDKNDTINMRLLEAAVWNDDDGTRLFSIEGDKVNGHANGHFTIHDLLDEIAYQTHTPMPTLMGEAPTTRRKNMVAQPHSNADIQLTFSNMGEVLHLVAPQVEVANEIRINGTIDSDTHSSWFEVESPRLATGGMEFRGIKAALSSHQGRLNADIATQQTTLPVLGEMNKLRIDAQMEHDELTSDFSWFGKGSSDIENAIYTQTQFVSNVINKQVEAFISVDKSQVLQNGEVWMVDSCRVYFHHDGADIRSLSFVNGDHKISTYGRASASPTDSLHIAISKIVLDDIFPEEDKDARVTLRGDLYANGIITEVLGNPHLDISTSIGRLWVDGDRLDSLAAKAQWDPNQKEMDVDLAIITKGRPRAVANGFLDLDRNLMNLDFDIDSLSTGFLKFYLSSSMSEWRGSTSGALQLHGPLDDIQLDARLKLNDDNYLRVKQTGVSYHIDKEDSVILSPKMMEFRNIQFCDRYGKRGIFRGSISHNMFSGLYTDLSFNVDNVLVLETSATESPAYYGKVFGSGDLQVYGPTANIRIDIDARTEQGTVFNIAPSAKSDVSHSGGIIMVQEDTPQAIEDLDMGMVTAGLKLHITPNAEVNVVVDDNTNNKLTARGIGDLSIEIDNEGELTMNGDYEVTSGNYHFSLMNLINKDFTINPNSNISWNGDPYDGILDISATYNNKNKLKGSLSTLIQGNIEEFGAGNIKDRVPVKVNIFLTDKLMQPTVKFAVVIESSQNFSQMTFDQYVNTEEDINRQAFSLLATGNFLAAQDAATTQSGQTYMSTAGFDLLSSQLSNLLSQNMLNIDIGVTYNPGDEVANEEYTLAVHKQVLDNKLTLSGNIGYGRDATSTSNSEGSVIGDFDIDYKIGSGKLHLKAYTHSNNDVIYETSPTTQGIGISYEEEFDSFRDLFRRYWNNIFRRRKEGKLEKE